MSYTATKDGVTKYIDKNMALDYFQLGWTVKWDNTVLTESFFANQLPHNTISNDPYTYSSVSQNRLEPIIIGAERFDDYSSFLCVNTKTYQTTPERAMNGSIPDINDIQTFIVPRVKIKFDKMSIQDFRRMLKAIEPNEFPVQYYDYEQDKIVRRYMYIEPREMAEIYNIGFEILDVLGYEFSFIGTLNDEEPVVITYFTHLDNKAEPVRYFSDNFSYGQTLRIRDGESLSSDRVPDGKHFVCWYLNNEPTQIYLSNQRIYATSNLNLYAHYE